MATIGHGTCRNRSKHLGRLEPLGVPPCQTRRSRTRALPRGSGQSTESFISSSRRKAMVQVSSGSRVVLSHGVRVEGLLTLAPDACGSDVKSGGSVVFRWECGTTLIGASAQEISSNAKFTPELTALSIPLSQQTPKQQPKKHALRHLGTDCRSFFQTVHRPSNVQVKRLIPCRRSCRCSAKHPRAFPCRHNTTKICCKMRAGAAQDEVTTTATCQEALRIVGCKELVDRLVVQQLLPAYLLRQIIGREVRRRPSHKEHPSF